MGILIKGQWVLAENESAETKRAMEKSLKHLRKWITPDGRGFSEDYPNLLAYARGLYQHENAAA